MLDMPPAPERCSYRLLSTLNPSETPSVIAVFVAPDSGPWRRSVGVAAEVGGPDRGRIPGRHRVSALDNSCSAGLAGSVRPAFGIRSARTHNGPRSPGARPILRRERSARCGAGAGRIGTGTQTLTPTPFRGIAESRAGRYSRRRARSTRMCPARECLCVPTWPMAPDWRRAPPASVKCVRHGTAPAELGRATPGAVVRLGGGLAPYATGAPGAGSG